MTATRLRASLAILLIICSISAAASVADTVTIDNTRLLYYYIKTPVKENKGLIIYMHGGVSQYKEPEHPIALSPAELLEGNPDFIPVMQKAGYDVILPVAYHQYNWLEDEGELFIKKIVETYARQYKQVIISGFSDGATGAFRFFYNQPENYDGVIIFNGYPQLHNYYKKVDHYKAIGKKIIYCTTISDKVIPYEFLLVEFRRQQMINEHTYFILKEGEHAFTAYNKADFEQCTQLLNTETLHTAATGKLMLFPPIDGLIVEGLLKTVYPFRKKQGKSYSMSPTEYARDDYDYKTYSKLLQSGATIKLQPIEVTRDTIEEAKTLDFTLVHNGDNVKTSLTNWLNMETW